MKAFLACTLVLLDKNTGIHPIGIGEVLRRIVGKTLTTFLKREIQDAARNLQLCAGQPESINDDLQYQDLMSKFFNVRGKLLL